MGLNPYLCPVLVTCPRSLSSTVETQLDGVGLDTSVCLLVMSVPSLSGIGFVDPEFLESGVKISTHRTIINNR